MVVQHLHWVLNQIIDITTVNNKGKEVTTRYKVDDVFYNDKGVRCVYLELI